MENYSRSNKNKTKSSKKPTKQHIKTGLSAFQKTIATVASILSIIIASITIMNLTGQKDEKSKTDNILDYHNKRISFTQWQIKIMQNEVEKYYNDKE